MKLVLGIDPGISGGAAIISTDRSFIQTISFKNSPSSEIVQWLEGHKPCLKAVLIEKVHSYPKQGVCSVFTFGQNYGFWIGILTGLGISYKRVYPLRWQTTMQCRTGGDKNITKTKAQNLFPKLKITHAIADALLIAEYGRRNETGWCDF